MTIQLPHLPDWFAYLLALLLPSPMGLMKGLIKVKSLIPSLQQLVAVVALCITIAEDALQEGSGEEKKAKVIKDVIEVLPSVAESMNAPQFLVSLFANEQILSFVIDLLVAGANASGHFKKEASANP